MDERGNRGVERNVEGERGRKREQRKSIGVEVWRAKLNASHS